LPHYALTRLDSDARTAAKKCGRKKASRKRQEEEEEKIES